MNWRFVAAGMLMFCLQAPTMAAPLHPAVLAEKLARGDTCGIACPSSVGNAWVRATARPSLASSFGGAFFAPNKTPAAKGVVKVAVIPVQFQADAVTTTTGVGQFQTDGHGDTTSVGDSIEIMMSRADTYYRAVSYNLMQLSYTVFDTAMVTVSQAMSNYTNSVDVLVPEVLGRADTFINYGAYDILVILHAGAAANLSSASGDITAQFNFKTGTDFFYRDTQTNDTISMAVVHSAFGIVVSGETHTMLGTLCHEMGHALGLPDLYNTASGAGGIGNWGLMGTGNLSGTPRGDSPSWLCAWSREFLGWADTKLLDTAQTISSFKRVQEDSTIYKIKVNASVDTEYFLLEVREPKNSDLDSAPGSGMLIWHIDNSMGSLALNNVNKLSGTNSVAHRRVDLEEADGSDVGASILTVTGTQGTGSQPWPGYAAKTGFGNNSTPGSNGYYDTTTARFALKSIATTSSITFAVDFSDVNIITGEVIKYPSTCLIGRMLAPWPRLAAGARSVRDWMLGLPLGRRLQGLM